MKEEWNSKRTIVKWETPSITSFLFWCVGCRKIHSFVTKTKSYEGMRWIFNGDIENPGFTPGLFHSEGEGKEDEDSGIKRCHLYMMDGKIQYLQDTTHYLSGCIVELSEIDEDTLLKAELKEEGEEKRKEEKREEEEGERK